MRQSALGELLDMKHNVLLIFLIFVAGVLFRLWFISLAPQPFMGDQTEYEWYAAKIFLHPQMLESFSFRSYPYPLFLATVYKFVGFGNHEAIFFLQAILDAFSGVMVFLMTGSWIAFILYQINPFTSGYVGVILSEVLSIFFITATILFGAFFVKKPKFATGFLFGLAAGLAAETRNAAFLWAAIPIGLAYLFIRSKKYFFAILLGVIVTIIYPLYVNWRDYKEISITTVDSIFARELWNGAILKTLPPFAHDLNIAGLREMYMEFYSERNPGRTSDERKAIAKKYMNSAFSIIKNDPIDYIKVRLDKMWYMWQKENVFFYEEPGFNQHKAYTYALNLAILVLAAFGLWRARRNWLWWTIIGTVIYGTLVFSITHAEYRLTIPFYPLLVIAASWAF